MDDSRLTSAEEKALDIMLTAERNFYMQFIKSKSGAFCNTEYELDGEYINVKITHGVQNDAEDTKDVVCDRLVRSTMKWDNENGEQGGY